MPWKHLSLSLLQHQRRRHASGEWLRLRCDRHLYTSFASHEHDVVRTTV